MSSLSISPTTTRKVVAAIAAFLLVSIAIVRTSDAAFSATTTNDGNVFATGELSLDNNASAPLFGDRGANTDIQTDAVNLAPGDVRESCIEITYDGSFTDLTEVQLAVTAGSGDLVADLQVAMVVTDACTDGVTYGASGNLASVAGATGWTPTNTEETQAFHFQVTVGDDAEQDAEATGIDLSWSVATSTN